MSTVRVSPMRPYTLRQELARMGARIALAALGWRFRLGARLRPTATVASACALFCTPLAAARKRLARTGMRGAHQSHLLVDGTRIATYRWGDPTQEPWVLLVHGWSGSAASFLPWVDAFRDAGHAVVAFDQAAHGRSEGVRSDLPRFVQVLRAVVDAQPGAPAALVGHSLGGTAVAVALARGLQARRAIVIAPSADLAAAIQRFTRLLRLPAGFGARMVDAFEAGTVPIADLRIEHIAPAIAVRGLVVHDLGDREIPHLEGLRFAHHWPGARLLSTQGLGHARILCDPGVIATSVQFATGLD